jgi:hypothetical protein
MSPDYLLRIRKVLNENKVLESAYLDDFIQLMAKFKRNNVIYPGTFLRKLNVCSNTIYNVFETLEKDGILLKNFEIYCHICDRYNSENYQHYSEIPKMIECESCGEEVKRENSVIVVYKVIDDGR